MTISDQKMIASKTRNLGWIATAVLKKNCCRVKNSCGNRSTMSAVYQLFLNLLTYCEKFNDNSSVVSIYDLLGMIPNLLHGASMPF